MKLKLFLFAFLFLFCGSDVGTEIDTNTSEVVSIEEPVQQVDQNKGSGSHNNREIEYFIASTVSIEHQNMLKEWIKVAEDLYFNREGVVVENLYPIYVAQLDRDNPNSAKELETEFCEFLNEKHNSKLSFSDGYDKSKCAQEEEYDDDGLFLQPNGDVAGSSISSVRLRDGYYLFISKTHDLPRNAASMGFVTLHEMFHIFQKSHITSTKKYDEQNKIIGRVTGDDPDANVPWWHEGTTVYFSYADYARQINDWGWFIDEMRCTIFCEKERFGNKSRLEVYQSSGLKLNNITFDGYMGVDKQIGYEVGAWFIAYLVRDHGEEKILNLYPLLEEYGFEEAFKKQFQKDYRVYLEEFDEFLKLPEKEMMKILLTK